MLILVRTMRLRHKDRKYARRLLRMAKRLLHWYRAKHRTRLKCSFLQRLMNQSW